MEPSLLQTECLICGVQLADEPPPAGGEKEGETKAEGSSPEHGTGLYGQRASIFFSSLVAAARGPPGASSVDSGEAGRWRERMSSATPSPSCRGRIGRL